MNAIAQINPSVIPSDPKQWTFYIFSIASAGVLTWFLTSRRTVAEIDKLRSEKRKLEADIVKLAGDTLREIQRTREAYSTACQKCKKTAQKVSLLMVQRAGVSEILAAREEFCDAFAKDAMDSYSAYVEWQALSLKSESAELRRFLESDVRPELERFAGWLRVLNAPLFIEGVKATPLKIEQRSLRPFYDLKRHFEADGEAQVKEVLEAALKGVHG